MGEKLNGPEKAAILILALGDDFANHILSSLDNQEVQRLGSYMTKTTDCSIDQVEGVIQEYHQKAFQNDQGIPYCNEEYVKKLILSSLGEERARPILEKLSSKESEIDLSFVSDIEPRNLVSLIKLEHPQTIALILSYMSSSKAAEAIFHLPEHLKAEVVMRMAGLETVDMTMVGEIAHVLEREVKNTSGASDSHKVSGLQTVAEIMNNLDKSITTDIFSYLQEKDKLLADGIQELMFVFDDLVQIDNRGIQAIMKNIDNETLITALKTANDDIKEKIFSNMSSRAAQMIEEEMEVMGPVRISDVEAAQKMIAATARKLEESGEIMISKGEGEIIV